MIDDVQNNDNGKNPFVLDAATHSDISKVPLVSTSAVKSFLSDDLFGVASEKGVGKTHLLRLKSKSLRDRQSADAIWIPRTELCEQFDRVTYAFNTRMANSYADPESWKVLWATSIAAVILDRANVPLPKTLVEIFSQERGDVSNDEDSKADLSIESCLLALLKVDLEQLRLIYPTHLKSLLTSRIERQVGVFVDSIDEAFDKHVGDTLWDATIKKRGAARQGVLKESIWTSAQLGLVAAARDIHRANRRIGVYFAVRREALQANKSALALQEESLIQDLHYSYDEVRGIFMSRVANVPRERLAKPGSSDQLEKFLGFSRIPHWHVRTEEGNAPEEDVFDFLYRHTFGRIREVLELGRIIYLMDPDERTPTSVRDAVDLAAGRLFEMYKREMIPFWDRANEAVFEHITCNVLTPSSLSNISNKVKEISDSPSHPFCYLYARGLLGRSTVRKGETLSRISFVHPGMYFIEKNQRLPTSFRYFVHPCLESTIREHSPTFQIDHRIIVGDGAVCELPEETAILTVQPIRRDKFSFLFRDNELPHLSTEGVVYATVFAVIAITVARKEKVEVSVEDMVSTAEQLISANLISPKPRTSKQSIVEIIKRMDKENDDTGKAIRRDIVEKLKKSLSDSPDNPALVSCGQDGVPQYLSYMNGSFRWLMCEPRDIDISRVQRRIDKR